MRVDLSRGRLMGAIVGLGVGLVVFLLFPVPGPEDMTIKTMVRRMANAAERRDVAFIMEQISDDFRTRDGADKEQLKGVIVAQVFRGEVVQVWPVSLEVELESPSQAQLQGRFVFGRSRTADLKAALEEGAVTVYRIDGQLEKEGDDWRFVSAEYERLEATDLF